MKMKKMDIHCHTTNRKVKDTLPPSADLDHILEQMEIHNVERTVLLATYFPHKASGVSNYRMVHWVRQTNRRAHPDTFHIFGSLDFEHYLHQGMNELNELAEEGNIQGVKIYTGYQHIDLRSMEFQQVADIAETHELPMAFHCGYSYSSMRKYGTPAIAGMVKARDLEFVAQRYEKTPIIACHLCKPFTDDLIEVMKRNPNLYTDMSGLIDSKFDRADIPRAVEDIRKVLHEVGPTRLLFGTDFPVQTHEDSVYFIETAMRDFSDYEKSQVYYRNADLILPKLDLSNGD
ncbi:MAG: amidohydrolase [Nanoarchaeota archaeon]|nr:amidohydrolase [Nanoarchaeota archaeon]